MIGKKKIEVEAPLIPMNPNMDLITVDGGLDVKDKTMLIAFPGVGFAGLIAGHYVVEKTGMKYIGTFVSDYMPSVATIHDAVPYYPIKIFTNKEVIALLSEFVPTQPLTSLIIKTIYSHFIDNGVKKVILLEGILLSDMKDGEDARGIYGIGIRDEINKLLENNGIALLKEGLITGISGMLLSEAYLRNSNVICFLAEAHPMYPDARAAASLIQALRIVDPQIKVDTKKLLENAVEIEKNVKETLMRSKERMDAKQKGLKDGDQRIRLPMYG